MAEKEAARLTHSLVALQSEIREHLRRKDDIKAGEAEMYYSEQCLDIVAKSGRSARFAAAVVKSPQMVQVMEAREAFLVLPLLKILNTCFESHPEVVKKLLKDEVSSMRLSDLVGRTADLVSLALNAPTDKKKKSLAARQDMLEGSVGVMARLVAAGRQDMLTFIVRRHPVTTDLLRKCAELIGSRDMNKLSMLFAREADRVREEQRAISAATTIQAHWRGLKGRREWNNMKKGFSKVQHLYKRRLKQKEKEGEMRLAESERTFQDHLARLIKAREGLEEQLKRIARGEDIGADKVEEDEETQSEQISAEEREKMDQAATVIQGGVRRWLYRRKMRSTTGPMFALPLRPDTLFTEARQRRCQAEIDAWQRKHKICNNMSEEELQELHNQLKEFNRAAGQRRARERKTEAQLASAQAMASLFEDAPTLDECTKEQRNKFKTLPLLPAMKGRADHNEELERMEMPKWQRTLLQFA